MRNIEYNIAAQKFYERIIIERFDIHKSENITFYYGAKARQKAGENEIKHRNSNGYFDYVENGDSSIVYVFDGTSIGTLAHEIYHAKQFERNERYFEGNRIEIFKYKFLGANYKLERQADSEGLKFLKVHRIGNEYKKYRRRILKRRIGSPVVVFLSMILLILTNFISL